MKNVKLDLPAELADFFAGPDHEYLKAQVIKTLKKELAFKKAGGAQELVRVVTRTKARVCNWEDLEREILKGAIRS